MPGEETIESAMAALADGGQDGGNVEPQTVEQAGQQPGGTVKAETGEKPEDWKAKYEGLQGNFRQVHQELERQRETAQQQAQREQQMAEALLVLQAQAQGVPDDQIGALRGQFRQQQEVMQALQQLAERSKQRDAMLAPVEREHVIGQLAAMHGVAKEDVLQVLAEVGVDHPAAADALARYLARQKRTSTLQERKAAGVDRAEGGGGGGLDTSRLTSSELIRAGLQQYKG
jgi:small-conductance mechanosensitive channel